MTTYRADVAVAQRRPLDADLRTGAAASAGATCGTR